jgi:hypothetical protein
MKKRLSLFMDASGGWREMNRAFQRVLARWTLGFISSWPGRGNKKSLSEFLLCPVTISESRR